MSSIKNKHCILETSTGSYVVSSYRDEDGGRYVFLGDYETNYLEFARNVARSRSIEYGGTWHDAPGYDIDSESSSRVGQSDHHTTPDSKESTMTTEIEERIAKLEGKLEAFQEMEKTRQEIFMNRMKIWEEFVGGKPSTSFMKSVIEQLTDDCYTTALADEAIKRAIKSQIEEKFLTLDIENKILDEIKEGLSVDISCYL
jgi:hypothetical protein